MNYLLESLCDSCDNFQLYGEFIRSDPKGDFKWIDDLILIPYWSPIVTGSWVGHNPTPIIESIKCWLSRPITCS